MVEIIDKIPLPLSLLRDPIASEIGYEAWDRADILTFAGLARPVSKRITDFYYFGYYNGQVGNGGHSQLVYNMDIAQHRSPYLVDGFISGGKAVGAPECAGLGHDFQNWLVENPVEAEDQTGFEGGRAEFLDDLDERHSELNESLEPMLIDLRKQTTDPRELKFLNDCIGRQGDWSGDLNALETIWVLRSGIILPVADNLYDAAWNSLFSQQN